MICDVGEGTVRLENEHLCHTQIQAFAIAIDDGHTLRTVFLYAASIDLAKSAFIVARRAKGYGSSHASLLLAGAAVVTLFFHSDLI